MREAAPDVTAAGRTAPEDAAPAPILQARGLCFDAGGKRLVDHVDADFRARRRTASSAAAD